MELLEVELEIVKCIENKVYMNIPATFYNKVLLMN